MIRIKRPGDLASLRWSSTQVRGPLHGTKRFRKQREFVITRLVSSVLECDPRACSAYQNIIPGMLNSVCELPGSRAASSLAPALIQIPRPSIVINYTYALADRYIGTFAGLVRKREKRLRFPRKKLLLEKPILRPELSTTKVQYYFI